MLNWGNHCVAHERDAKYRRLLRRARLLLLFKWNRSDCSCTVAILAAFPEMLRACHSLCDY